MPLVNQDTGAVPRGTITALLVDSQGIYWNELDPAGGDSVRSCALSGCDESTTIIEGTGADFGSINGAPFAVDDAFVYTTFEAPLGPSVVRCQISGCPMIQSCLGQPQQCPPSYGASLVTIGAGEVFSDVALRGAEVDFLTSGDSKKVDLDACGAAGCSDNPTVLASRSGVDVSAAIVVAGDALVWSAKGALFTCKPPSCATPEMLVAKQAPDRTWGWTSLAATSTSAYWFAGPNGPLLACPLTGCQGKPKVIDAGAITAVSADDRGVYYWKSSTKAEETGLYRCAGDCSTPTPIPLTKPVGGGPIALDAQNVYFSDGADIWKIPRRD
jgi:hypothetical protein